MLSWLLDSHPFMTRDHCGIWPDWLLRLNQWANLLIFIAYTTIPLALFRLWLVVRCDTDLRRTAAEHPAVILMFVVFILSCGLTHLMDVLAFSWAPYRLFTLIDLVTAVASVPTAFFLPGVIRQMLEKRRT